MFVPTKLVRRVTDITAEMLNEMDIEGIILDVDETLAKHGSQEPFEGVKLWIKYLQAKEVKIIIVSNNFRRRVEPFALKLSVPFITVGLKPFPFGLIRAAKKIGCKIKKIAVVGDQIFTDILGANLCGMKSILVEPVSNAVGLTMKIKRKLERPIRRKMRFKDDDTIYKN